MESRRLFSTDFVSDAMGLGTTPFVQVNGTSYFLADNGTTGRELWKSDGTTAGTVFVKDLTPGPAGSDVLEMFQAGSHAIIVTFVRHHPTDEFATDYTVWSSDGSSGGTVKLAQFTSAEFRAKQVGDRVAFVGMSEHNLANPVPGDPEPDHVQTDAKLYFTDGTTGGTKVVKSFTATWTLDPNDPDAQAIITDWRVMAIRATGNRVVLAFSDRGEFWSSDGTSAGTFPLTSIVSDNWSSDLFENMAEFNGKVYIPGSGRIWSTDGTDAGTHEILTDALHVEKSLLAGSKYYVQHTVVPPDDSEPTKHLAVIDLDDGTTTNLFDLPSNISGLTLLMKAIGDRLVFGVADSGRNTFKIYTSDGTAAGTVLLSSVTRDFAMVASAVTSGDSVYFLLSSGGLDPSIPDWFGDLGAGDGFMRSVNAPGGKLELWRSDGLGGDTGLVRTVWDGDLHGKRVLGTISDAAGKLVIRTEVATGEAGIGTDPADIKTIFDDTLYYDPSELSLARDVATVKLTNGVLRLNGTMGPDNFRVYLDAQDPSLLVVEFNGSTRTLALSDVRRIVADLQDGNDRFEMDETVGGEMRLWTSIIGGDGADTIITSNGHDTIIGGSGPDMIRARGNDDLIIAGGGRDRITGGQGDDVISGGTGDDSVIGGSGGDVLFGQSARERAFGSAWEDLQDLQDDVVLASL